MKKVSLEMENLEHAEETLRRIGELLKHSTDSTNHIEKILDQYWSKKNKQSNKAAKHSKPTCTGYTVGIQQCATVVFEWNGDGKTPREIAEDAWDNMRECSSNPMVTVLEPDGTITTVDLEYEDEDEDDD